MPIVTGELSASLRSATVEVDAGVGQREQRHHDEARPGMQPVLQALVGRDRRGQAALRDIRELGRGLLAKGARQLGRALQIAARRRVGARHQPDRQAGDDRVDARPKHRQPHPDAHEHGPGLAPAAREPQCHEHREQRERDREREQRNAIAVGEGDDEQRTEIVDDRERQQEHAQPRRTGGRDERKRAEGERRVGGHRRPPSPRAGAAGVDREVHADAQRHAAQGCDHRDRDAAPLAQLAEVELTLGLQADDEEEQRHQPFIHPLAQAPRQGVLAQAERQSRAPQRFIGVRPGRVGPQQRRERRADEHRRPTGLGAQKVPYRRAEIASPGRAAGGVAGPGAGDG